MQQRKDLRSSWVILACAWLMAFAMFTPMLCVPPIMQIIREELLLTHAQAGIIFSIPLIMLAALAIPSGILADKIGIRRAAGIGAIVIIIGSLLRGTSTSFITLLAFSCLYGAGFGLVYPNLPKLVATWFESNRVGLATGIYTTGMVAGSGLALTITLPVIFPISNTFQGVFYVWTIPTIAAAVTWWVVVKDHPISSVPNEQTEEGINLSNKIWTNRNLWLIAIMFFVSCFTYYSWVGWTPELMVMKGASPNLAAFMTSIILWVCLPIVFVMPWLSDRIGLRKPFLWIPFLASALVSLGAVFAPLALGWLIVAAFGVATGTAFVVLLTLPPEFMPVGSVGRASGMMLSIGYTGGLAGPWIAGHIMDVTRTLNLHLIIIIVLAAVATYLARKLPETGPKVRSRER